MPLKKSAFAKLMLTTAATLTAAAATTPADAKSNCPVEKCYGIVKKLKNDCGTPKHACAAQAATNSDPTEWMFVMKGNCTRIIGGSLTPPNAAAPKK